MVGSVQSEPLPRLGGQALTGPHHHHTTKGGTD
jgi:hypothetical protein